MVRNSGLEPPKFRNGSTPVSDSLSTWPKQTAERGEIQRKCRRVRGGICYLCPVRYAVNGRTVTYGNKISAFACLCVFTAERDRCEHRFCLIDGRQHACRYCIFRSSRCVGGGLLITASLRSFRFLYCPTTLYDTRGGLQNMSISSLRNNGWRAQRKDEMISPSDSTWKVLLEIQRLRISALSESRSGLL